MNTPTAVREARWFWIPGIFGILLLLSLLLRWLPAALIRSHAPFGIGQVIAGDINLAWQAFLRTAVAYVLTALAFDHLIPIRWPTAFAIALAALLAEITAEVALGALFGIHAGIGIQLITSAVAYALTLTLSLTILDRLDRNSLY
jgi:hypothetical protein